MNNRLDRGVFVDRLQNAITRAAKDGSRFALLLVEFDQVYEVEMLPSWPAWDRFLKTAAPGVQPSPPEDGAVIRISSNGFAIILEQIASPEHAENFVSAIAAHLHVTDADDVVQHPGIGVCVFPEDGVDELSLLSRARSALQRARASGGERNSRSAIRVADAEFPRNIAGSAR